MQSYFSYILDENTANILLFFFDIFVILGGLICAVILLGVYRKRKNRQAIGVYGVYDNATAVYSEKVNFVKKALVSPTFLIFVAFCAIQSVVVGVLLYTA